MPGLFFLGLTWQHTRGSALIGWVKDDAEFIAAQSASNYREGVPESDTPVSTAAPSAGAAPATEGGL